jgi:hypothetical protein
MQPVTFAPKTDSILLGSKVLSCADTTYFYNAIPSKDALSYLSSSQVQSRSVVFCHMFSLRM